MLDDVRKTAQTATASYVDDVRKTAPTATASYDNFSYPQTLKSGPINNLTSSK